MPQPFPGPSHPSRFRLRRSPRYPSTPYDGEHAANHAAASSSLTRRGLLGGLLLAAGTGAVEAVRWATRATAPWTVGTPPGLPPSLVNLLTGSVRPSGTSPSSQPSRVASPSTTPTHSHTAAHSHGAQHHGGHHHGSSRHETKQQRQRLAREHVTLPPAKLKVRNGPVYRLDQLIPNPPHHAIALTIDDGPDPLYTPAVLRLLDKYQTQAAFCVVGIHADAYPKLVRDISRAGHIIVNHSYTHYLPFNRLPEKRIVTEITRTQRAIERAAGVTPQLFRSPGGDWSHFILRACASYGLEPLDWDVDPRDWARPGTRKITRRMLKVRPGEIVLCHDGGGNRVETVRALRRVLPSWQRKGLQTIPLQIQPQSASDGSSPSPSPTS